MKIAFNFLAVEITRKCQLQCAHCLRGDAQNINMENGTIATLLNQTSDIEYLGFTGGEPTLNIDGMNFFLDTMIKNDIHLSKLEIVTNGILLSKQFIDLLKRYYAWIEKSNSPYKAYIMLEVSDDKYHNGVDVKKAVTFYTEQLKKYPKIKIDTRGVADVSLSLKGRAKKLLIREALDSIQKDIYNIRNIKRKTKIEVLTKTKKTFCPSRKFEQVRDNEARILCPIMITAKGDFVPTYISEYVEEDNFKNKICNVEEDILQGIDRYNLRLPYCIEFDFIKQNIFDTKLQEYNFKKGLEIFKHNLNNPNNKIEISKTLLNDNEKWNKYIDETNQRITIYQNEKSDDEISFEPTEQDCIEIYEELLDLYKKSAVYYLKEKNHRQPTEEEILYEMGELYRYYERILST